MIYQALKCACYLHCFRVPFPYFLISVYLLRTHDNSNSRSLGRTFFDFPGRFELSGVDCTCKKLPFALIQVTVKVDLNLHSCVCPAVKSFGIENLLRYCQLLFGHWCCDFTCTFDCLKLYLRQI